MQAAGSSHGAQPASGGRAANIAMEAPPRNILNKPCKEGKPWERELHCWSWTNTGFGARVELKSGEWNHMWLAHELCHHGMVMSATPMQGKLKHTKPSDHESDTNYYCWLTDMPASGGGWAPTGWAATMGYSRFKDKLGCTHGWVQFGKGCNTQRKRVATVAVFLECFGFEPDSVESSVVLPAKKVASKA